MKFIVLIFSLLIIISCGKFEVSGDSHSEVTSDSNSSKKGKWGSEKLKGKEISGYSCIKDYSFSVAACASQKKYECINQFSNVICGIGCEYDYIKGKHNCTEEDLHAQYIN
jgi:hypothetical protein